MKSRIRPASRRVVMRDRVTDVAFLTRSATDPARSIEGKDGNTCPVIGAAIPSAGHPFCTGTSGVVDAVGGVARFERPYGREAFTHY